MEVDAGAPAVARAEIDVSAPRDVVWAVLTDIESWPSWNPGVKSASVEGPLADGTRFRWKAGPGTITSTLRQVEPPRLIAWSGTTFGIKAIHVHRLDEARRRDDRHLGGVVGRPARPAAAPPAREDAGGVDPVRPAALEDRGGAAGRVRADSVDLRSTRPAATAVTARKPHVLISSCPPRPPVPCAAAPRTLP